MADFMEALDVKVEDVVRPPLIPVGVYRAIVSKVPEITKSDDEKWTFVTFLMKFQSVEKADPDELREFGNVVGEVRSHRFIISNDPAEENRAKQSRFNLKRFLTDHLQVEVERGMGLPELIDRSVNHSCLVTIGRRTDSRDKETQYDDIKSTAPL